MNDRRTVGVSRVARARGVALIALVVALIGGVSAALWPRGDGRGVHTLPAEPECTAELRSWVVAGWARHLYLQIEAPPGHEELAGRVEFTSVALRGDYRVTMDGSGSPRIGRMTPGRALAPTDLAPLPDNRVEARYRLTLDQARCVQRDRVYSEPYVLLGANSNAALRRTLESCGLGFPDRVLGGGGIFGEFPGIDRDPGPELLEGDWGRFGLQRGRLRGGAPNRGG